MGLILDLTKDTYKDKISVVTVGNTGYMTYKSFNVSRSIDDVCGTFDIAFSRPEGGNNPFKTGDVIDIVLDKVQVMRGKIYEVGIEGDASTDDIVIAGRDITGDIVDSTVPDEAKVYTGNISIFEIASKILTSLGVGEKIKLRNSAGVIDPFRQDEIISCNTGDTVIDFLLKYCAKRQLFLNTDRTGALVFFKADGVETDNRLINKFKSQENNVISYKTKFNTSERFYRYICKTQDAKKWFDSNGPDVDANGIGLDTAISTFRQLEFKMEEGGIPSECTKRAEEEANVRKARGFESSYIVQGFKDKITWATNQFVTISDDKSGISGQYLVKSVAYNLDNETGRTTELVCTHRDAYTLEASIGKRATTGKEWTNG